MPTDEELSRAAELIRAGRLVAFPTETVYGLGANALDAEAVARIYEAKGRPASSPVIVHVADAEMAQSVAAEWPDLADRLASRFWPGPLTLVLRKKAVIPDIVTAGLDSLGVRVPAHPIALDLIRKSQVPIAAPSANRFAQLSPTTADHVRDGLGVSVDLILDGGPTTVGIESTVASLTGEIPAVLRPGMISIEELEEVTGVRWRTANAYDVSASPGLSPKHYAPCTPLFVLAEGARQPAGIGRILTMPRTARDYAAHLYEALHEADREGWDWIAVDEPPSTAEWAGIRDRLKRAGRPIPYSVTGSKTAL